MPATLEEFRASAFPSTIRQEAALRIMIRSSFELLYLRILEVMGAVEEARLKQRKISFLSTHLFSRFDPCLLPGWYPRVGRYVLIVPAPRSFCAGGNRGDVQRLAWCVEASEVEG